MDNRILIGFVVFLVLFLIFPIVMQKVNEGEGGGDDAPIPASGAATPKRGLDQIPELNQPPQLNEHNLIGTEWEVRVEQYRIKITLAAGGVAYATHPLAKAITGVDYLEGRWRVENDQLHISTTFGGQEHQVALKISGNDVYFIDQDNYEKMQRFN